MKTLLVLAMLAAAGPTALADDVPAEISHPGENGHIDVGLGIESRFGLVFQLTLVDRPRGIHIEGLSVPVTILARPATTGLVTFCSWALERSGQTFPSDEYLRDDVGHVPAGSES